MSEMTSGLVERLRAENEELREQGAQVVIAYHVAICSPKGVVPDDRFYDPIIAARCEREMAALRAPLPAPPGKDTIV